MLGKGNKLERGKGNLFFGSTLRTTRGYWKRTDEEVDKACDSFFHINSTDKNKEQQSFHKDRQKNMEEKRQRATQPQLKEWGTFVEPTDQWPQDDHFRIQFSNQMGFSSKAPTADFEEWMEQGDCAQCDIKAAVELNLSKRGTRRFQRITNDIDSRGQLFINHPLDPTKDLHKRIFLKGGSICWMPSHINARRHSFHKDKHGRWTAVRLTSATNKLVIVFAYRVCDSVITGETTSIAAREQTSLLLMDHANALDVRTAFLQDLGKFLSEERQRGNEILLLADGNTPKNHKEFVDFFAIYDMTDLLPDGAPPTCSRSNDSSRPTEIFFGTRLFEEAMHSIGFYPFYQFNGSDHRELEIVFNRKQLFAGSIPNTCHKRIINPKNVKHTTKFLRQLTKLHAKSKTMEALLKVLGKVRVSSCSSQSSLRRVMNKMKERVMSQEQKT